MFVDWEVIRETCSQTGNFYKIPKEGNIRIPLEFHESHMGLSKGALRQFRDDHATQSIHIHEFPDYFLVHVDAFNPEHHPIAHGFVDTPEIATGIILLAISFYGLWQFLRDPEED